MALKAFFTQVSVVAPGPLLLFVSLLLDALSSKIKGADKLLGNLQSLWSDMGRSGTICYLTGKIFSEGALPERNITAFHQPTSFSEVWNWQWDCKISACRRSDGFIPGPPVCPLASLTQLKMSEIILKGHNNIYIAKKKKKIHNNNNNK